MNTVVPDTVGFSSSRLDRIGTVVQSYVDQGKLPGAVTMIARRGQVVHAECFGMRDIEAKKTYAARYALSHFFDDETRHCRGHDHPA